MKKHLLGSHKKYININESPALSSILMSHTVNYIFVISEAITVNEKN